ncbi:MAG TPA: hypothetical protein P5121_24685, partial [Caldilineaceae bacterium]|nr:hypothetical protein [Caldilineaceae bacterium]
MRFLKNNFAYLVLGAVALALIFITISLQVSFLSVQEPSAEGRGLFTTLRTEIAGWLLPASLPEEEA